MRFCTFVCVLSACGTTPALVPPMPQPPDPSIEGEPSRELDCLTLRDQELACDNDCESVRPFLYQCADQSGYRVGVPVRHYRLEVRAISDGLGGVEQVQVAVPRNSDPALQEVAWCLQSVFRRYRPCFDQPRGERIAISIIANLPDGR